MSPHLLLRGWKVWATCLRPEAGAFPTAEQLGTVLEREDPGWLISAFYSLKAAEETKFLGEGRRRHAVQPSWKVGAGVLRRAGACSSGEGECSPTSQPPGRRASDSLYIIDLPGAPVPPVLRSTSQQRE